MLLAGPPGCFREAGYSPCGWSTGSGGASTSGSLAERESQGTGGHITNKTSKHQLKSQHVPYFSWARFLGLGLASNSESSVGDVATDLKALGLTSRRWGGAEEFPLVVLNFRPCTSGSIASIRKLSGNSPLPGTDGGTLLPPLPAPKELVSQGSL